MSRIDVRTPYEENSGSGAFGASPIAALPGADDLAIPCAALRHSVQFYEDDVFLAGAVADYLAVALTTRQPAIAIVTAPHRDAFISRLRENGFDADSAIASGQLTFLDAVETFSGCVRDGEPDRDSFRRTICAALDKSLASGAYASVRLYGEMVDILWKEGRISHAIKLEELWNELIDSYPISLLCGYEMQNFSRSEDAERFAEVCRMHTHVVPGGTYAGASVEGRMVEISRLQQRAQALEAEIDRRVDLEERLRKVLVSQRRTEEVLRQRERELRETLAERETLLDSERAARADAERAREQADEANKTKSSFLASMSHELRTPLNAIAGYVQLVELGIHGPVTEAQKTALHRVQRSQQHLLALINDLLNFARLEAGKVDYRVERVSLPEVVTEVAGMMEPQLAAKGITYVSHTSSADVALADWDKLQQVLINLLTNAVKFTPSGGQVEISTGKRGDLPRTVFIRVADTGCGIPEDRQSDIFDPFVQVGAQVMKTQEGTGLGLAISRELARGMKGDIRVRSTEGDGSVFTVTLPAA